MSIGEQDAGMASGQAAGAVSNAPLRVHDGAGREVVTADLAFILKESGGFEKMAGKRLLVTGGAGFLGYYMVQAPLFWNRTAPVDQRIQVTVCDNYIRGTPNWLQELSGDENLRIIKHDITAALPDSEPEFDYIVHAASIASPLFYRQHPIETMDANIYGLRHLLDYCVRRKQSGTPVQGLLFFSSSEIYGDPSPDQIPTAETYWGHVSCTGPRACYDESKRYGETLSVNFARQHGVPVTVARPFNNYGPGLKLADARVLPDFARDILAGRDIVLLSDGRATRTFCYVADAVAGYFRILMHGKPGEAYNIGREQPEVSMFQLATTFADIARELLDYRGTVSYGTSADQDYLTHNPSRRCPSIDKARRELGFEPRVPLEDGLRRLLIWYATDAHAH